MPVGQTCTHLLQATQSPAPAVPALPRGAPDDLAKLQGVGPQIVKKLNDAGVFHYWQVAAMTPADVAKVDADLKLNGRIDRDGAITEHRVPTPDASLRGVTVAANGELWFTENFTNLVLKSVSMFC